MDGQKLSRPITFARCLGFPLNPGWSSPDSTERIRNCRTYHMIAMKPLTSAPHQVVIIGGGFAGIQAARSLLDSDHSVEIVLVDRRNFTLFQPLLYQVATGLLSPADIATPLRPLFRDHPRVRVILDEAIGFDPFKRQVFLRHGDVPYDTLIVATGSRHHYFNHPEWEVHAPGLKTLEDAEIMRTRIFTAMESAELATDETQRRRLLTFVIAGGGATGVELAGTVAEITRHTTVREFRRCDPSLARIVLIELHDRLLSGFSVDSSTETLRALGSLGVEVMLSTRISDVSAEGVTVVTATGPISIPSATVLWAAGVVASPLGSLLATSLNRPLARGGRVSVGDDCAIPGHPNIFVLGDLAEFIPDQLDNPENRPLPGVAQVALQQGVYVGQVITNRLRGDAPPPPFIYKDRGSMAAIGRRLAVAEIGAFHLRGRLAWLAWLALHLIKLMQVQSRILVLVQWVWSYATWNRRARLITGQDPDQPLLISE